uniref:DMT family transporter n=1 Tax=Thaumasiovibrio occultus TaxID=1891184 RepID=UPI000B352576|nr:DMT family transporter [Thaumasiovibrio occultus]
MQRQTTGAIFALIACALFSLKPILIKIAYSLDLTLNDIMFLRGSLSLPIYAVTLLLLCRSHENRQKVRAKLLPIAATGLLGYVFASALDLAGLQYVSAQLERLIIFLFPSFVVLLNWGITRQRPANIVWLALLLGYSGIATIVVTEFQLAGTHILIGAALVLCSALVFAVYLLLSKTQITAVGSDIFTSVALGTASLILIVVNIPFVAPTSYSVNHWVLGIAIAILCTVLPSYFIGAAMARMSPTRLSLISNFGPALTALFAVIWLDEVFTLSHAFGLALVVFSVVLIQRRKETSAEKQRSPTDNTDAALDKDVQINTQKIIDNGTR